MDAYEGQPGTRGTMNGIIRLNQVHRVCLEQARYWADVPVSGKSVGLVIQKPKSKNEYELEKVANYVATVLMEEIGLWVARNETWREDRAKKETFSSR